MTRSTRRSGLVLALAVLLTAALAPTSAFAASPSATATAAPPKDAKVIVTYKDNPGKAATRAIERLGGKVTQKLTLIDGLGVTIPRGQLKKLRADPAVASVELDHQLVAFSDPPDFEYDNAWGVDRIGAQEVHLAGNTGQGVKVAIIDTGIDYIHDDPDDSPYVVDPEFLNNYKGGYDFFNNDNDPMDDNGHGTHVAGILAAEHNGYLVTGVAPGVDIYALKILNEAGEGEYSGLIAALGWAVAHDIDVVNMSVGAHDVSAALEAAVVAAYNAGVTMVAASGNINLLDWQEIFYGCAVAYPAAYEQVIAASFTGTDDRLTGYSCTGPQVDFAAPGDNIYSTVPTGTCMFCTPYGYNAASGTSMASPHVAGVVALILSAGIADDGDGILADDVKAHLCANTSPAAGMATTDPRYPNWYGCGIVDADKALIDNPPPGGGGGPTGPTTANDTATTAEDTATDVAVLANDTDPAGDGLTVTAVTDPAHGTATVNPNGTVHYVPDADYAGPDAFDYTIADSTPLTDTGSVAVTVSPVNDPPFAVDETASTPEGTSTLIDVLANDSDIDGGPLVIASVGAPSHGTTAIEAGQVRYTPTAGYTGLDAFDYTVSDGAGGTEIGSVTVAITEVNHPPVANDDAATTAEDTSKLVDVRANDTDVDGNTLTVTDVGAPGHGTTAIEAGQIRYTPAANYAGPDSFTYTVDDGLGENDSATVSITVTAVNDPPLAVDDAATTPEDVSKLIDVRANDTDIDGGALVISSVGAPSHGTTAIEAGQIRYTPAADYFGPDSFTYVVSDGAGGTDTGSVAVTVTSVPETNSMHVGDLDGSATVKGKNWTARVTIRIENSTHQAVANANVTGTWSAGATGSATCRTSVVGVCTVSKASISTGITSVTFTITGVTLSGRIYDGAANHDPDGDSTDGTVIVVNRP
jgi:subtilisin family serine protease